LQSPDYEHAAHRYDIEVSGASGSPSSRPIEHDPSLASQSDDLAAHKQAFGWCHSASLRSGSPACRREVCRSRVRPFYSMIYTPKARSRQHRRCLSLLACRLAEGQRSCGTIRTMNSKMLAHCLTASMEGEDSKENSLSLASLRSCVLVKIGLRTLPTAFP
jgi:hypothetical protein